MGDYYDPTPNYPQDGVESSAAQEQAEYQKIKADLSDRLAPYTNHAGQIVIINVNGTGQTVLPRGQAGQVLIEREGQPPHWGNFPTPQLPQFVVLNNGTAAIAWAVAHNTIAELTLNGNKTIGTAGSSEGMVVGIFLIQDGTGGRTVTWGNNFSWGEDGAPVLSAGANKRDFFSFIRRGDTWYNVGQSLGH